jgi:hypothetical protein
MGVVLAVAYFVATVALHAIWCRLSERPSVVVKLVLVGGAVGLGMMAHLYAAYGLSTSLLAGVLVYALACELYVFFFTLILSSVSAIWLRRLHRGSIDRSALAEAYSPAWMVDSRVERLFDNDFLTRTESGFRLTEKGRKLIRTFTRLRGLFNHAPRVAAD